MTTINGKYGIKATVVMDSISPQGVRITTMELEYPRIIHSEFLTHRMLSKNAASSRAIPFAKMLDQLGARPVRFGQANPGMQDKGVEHTAPVVFYHEGMGQDCALTPAEAWEWAEQDSISKAEAFYSAGYHKQVYNRLLEPFQFIKVVVTATEYGNFFWLRYDGAADPTIYELAQCMFAAREASEPMLLNPGEWHLPYVGRKRLSSGDGKVQGILYFIEDGERNEPLTLEDAIKVSSARSAAVSFRNVDYGIEKSIEVYNRLVGDERKHASALEHQATPMRETYISDWQDRNDPWNPFTWDHGISHVDRKGQLWSGNFKGWLQHRKLVAGENMEG